MHGQQNIKKNQHQYQWNSYSEFHEISTNGLVAVIRRTVGETDVAST